MTPWYDDGRAMLYVGHVLDVLAQLPAGSIQACVTSPPYYGLRSYSTEPQIWGGNDPACDHTLQDAPSGREPQTAGGASPKSTLNHGAGIRPGQKNAAQAAWMDTAPGKVLTGGTGTASTKQVSNAGSQFGNAWQVEHVEQELRRGLGLAASPASTRGGGHKAAEVGWRRYEHATCTRCGAWRGELGSEPIPDCLAWARGQEPCSVCFVCHLVVVFRAIRRVLHDTGTVFCNLGDSYSGSGKGPTGHNGIGDQGRRQGFVDQRSDVPGLGPKQLMMMPARVALALQADGWVLRQDIVWNKVNPMPESVLDRCTKAHEYIFMLAKKPNYYFDAEAIKEPSSENTHSRGNGIGVKNADIPFGLGVKHNRDYASRINEVLPTRNMRSVWTICTAPYPNAHFATFSPEIPRRAVLAGTSARGQCPACGAPWRRTTDVTRTFESGSGRSGNLPVGKNGAHLQGGGATLDIRRGPVVHTQTTGWAPSCSCDAGDPVPQIVLDPFAGSGTTLAVARWHQRRAVGIELSPEYARLIAQRLAQGVLL